MLQNDLDRTNFNSRQRILVVNRGSLLDEGVVRLISSRSNLHVSTVKFEDEHVLVYDIISKCPDVVVIGQTGNEKLEKLYKLLTSIPILTKLCMIIFHSNDNSVDIFSKDYNNSIDSNDFIALVQST